MILHVPSMPALALSVGFSIISVMYIAMIIHAITTITVVVTGTINIFSILRVFVTQLGITRLSFVVASQSASAYLLCHSMYLHLLGTCTPTCYFIVSI